MPPDADDRQFMLAWQRVEEFIDAARPEFILFQCGADSIAGDPITHLRYSIAAHGHAARSLCALADRHAHGRLLAMGGGGYNRRNLALAWTAVLESMVKAGTIDHDELPSYMTDSPADAVAHIDDVVTGGKRL